MDNIDELSARLSELERKAARYDLLYRTAVACAQHEVWPENMEFFWYIDQKTKELQFSVSCNDVFCWACAEAVEITPENIHIWEQAHKDCEEILPNWGYIYAPMLFAARVNQCRPQGACYPTGHDFEKLWPLFDAAGPEREVGLGNPYAPGEYHKKTEEEKAANEAARKEKHRENLAEFLLVADKLINKNKE